METEKKSKKKKERALDGVAEEILLPKEEKPKEEPKKEKVFIGYHPITGEEVYI